MEDDLKKRRRKKKEDDLKKIKNLFLIPLKPFLGLAQLSKISAFLANFRHSLSLLDSSVSMSVDFSAGL